MMSVKGTILVLSDEVGNGQLVQGLLLNQFPSAFLSCDAGQYQQDLAEHRPDVVVLAFADIEIALRVLHETSIAQGAPPQKLFSTIALCDKRQAPQAFELCHREVFDDYVMFWPVSHDGYRLPLAVLQALRKSRARDATWRDLAPPPQSTRSQARALFDSALARESEIVAAAMREMMASPQGNEFPESPPAPKAEPVVKPGWDAARDTVLFVDDDPGQHHILRMMMRGTAWNPTFADSAKSARRLLATLQPALILVDVNLPDGSGVDLMRALKADDRFARTPMITVTGQRTREIVISAVAAGAVDFIAKPYSKETVLKKVANALGSIDCAPAPAPAPAPPT